MKVPSSSNKRYLSGADWCIAALNRGTEIATGRPASFHIAVFLDGGVDPARLESGFRAFCRYFPLLWGAPARCWCLAPYWKSPRSATKRDVSVTRATLATLPMDAALRAAETLASQPDGLRFCRTALHILSDESGAGDALLFSFDHLLFDAGGAEAFLDLFFRFLNGDIAPGDFPPVPLSASAQLDGWRERFANSRRLNRDMIRRTDHGAASLPLPPDAPRKSFRFRVASFTVEESSRIRERAYATCGYLMHMPYALATAASALQPGFLRHANPEANFIVTVSTNKPSQGPSRPLHLFFNDLSFLYFSFAVSSASDRNALAQDIRDQFFHQVRQDMPAAIEDSNLLMRILPAGGFSKFMTWLFRDRMSSFALTCLGAPELRVPTVLGRPVRHHLHLPVIPAPPGIGLILNQSGDAYHAVLSCIDGIAPDEELDQALTRFRELLLNGPGAKD